MWTYVNTFLYSEPYLYKKDDYTGVWLADDIEPCQLLFVTETDVRPTSIVPFYHNFTFEIFFYVDDMDIPLMGPNEVTIRLYYEHADSIFIERTFEAEIVPECNLYLYQVDETVIVTPLQDYVVLSNALFQPFEF